MSAIRITLLFFTLVILAVSALPRPAPGPLPGPAPGPLPGPAPGPVARAARPAPAKDLDGSAADDAEVLKGENSYGYGYYGGFYPSYSYGYFPYSYGGLYSHGYPYYGYGGLYGGHWW